MEETNNHKFMRRCLELASKAEGMTYPNPLVGSVIVHAGEIIGEGFHLKAGLPHAEVNAINSVKEKDKLRESVLYVNLEPCSHYGKTPPCVDFIILNGIRKVVIGTTDTTEKVSGKGISGLRSAGCDVITGVMEKESRWINRRFFTFNEKKRPYIILKWAESADGFIDIRREKGMEGRPTWISGKPERVLVHKWRASEQSILVGAGTIRKDNPKLNVREWKGNDPVRLILSHSGVLENMNYPDKKQAKTIVFTHNWNANFPEADIIRLDEEAPSCVQITDYLHSVGIQSLFIEGGAEVLNHFISQNLWDEARIFTGNDHFIDGVRAPLIVGDPLENITFSGSMLKTYVNGASQ